MTLTEKISLDLNTAMKAGEKLRVETLRMLRAAMIELEKSGKAVTPEDELRAVGNQAKRRKDAMEEYRKANRPDRAELEEAELRIIEEYLPERLGDGQIREVVRGVIAETGASGDAGFKIVMPRAMGLLRGRADGNVVGAIVREELLTAPA